MRRFKLFLALWFLMPVSWALPTQADTGLVGIELTVPEGAHLRRTLNYTHLKTIGGQSEVGHINGVYDYRLLQTAEGFHVDRSVISLTNADFLLRPDKPLADISKSMMKFASSAALSYETDDSLTPTRFSDWPSVKSAYRSFFVQTFPIEGAESVFDQSYGAFDNALATKLMLGVEVFAAMPKNIGAFVGQPVVAKSVIAAPITGTPLDAEERLEIVTYDRAQHTAKVTYDFAPTANSIKQFVADLLPRMLKASGTTNLSPQQVTTYIEQSTFIMATHCDFEIDLKYGLITRGDCTKTVRMNLAGRDSGTQEHWVFSESFVQ